MERIDSHVHFWDLANKMNSWVLNADKKLQRSFLPDALPKHKLVHIEAHDSNMDTLKEVEWLKHFGDVEMRFISYADFFQPVSIFEKEIQRLAANKKIVGVRQIMAYHSTASYSPLKEDKRPRDFKTKLEILKKQDFVFECQMYPLQLINCLNDIGESGVSAVVEHMGLPLVDNDSELQTWRAMIKAMAEYENMVLKLSGFFMLNHEVTELKRCMEHILSHIPANRLCYGSNYPVCNSDDYSAWYRCLKRYIPVEKQRDIFYDTAYRIYWN
ncbi:MAG: amidohydrolase family protein [Francisellaceae bacterium]